jgi:hypothetical protein
MKELNIYTGDEGAEHRKRIFALVGEGKEENGIDRLDFQLQIKRTSVLTLLYILVSCTL